MADLQVFILDIDSAVGEWLRKHLRQIGVNARWVSSVSDLLTESDAQPPTVCLVALRPPMGQTLSLITDLTQEPRFAQTSFILMGPTQYKRTAFEAGADDYLTTPPDVIELRKRVRLYLDRAELEARLVAETRISQEMEAFGKATTSSEGDSSPDPEAITLLEHAAALTQERNMFETMLQHAGDAMAFIDAEGILRYANPAWERLTGQRLADHLNQPASWPPLTDNPETTQEIADTVARQQPWRGIITTHRADGSPLSVTMSIRPILDSGGDLRGFVVTQRDIAER